jgi:uncharacterized protein YkwD
MNEQSRTLAALIITDPKQQRNRLVCSPALARIAADKAREMAGRGIVSHVGNSHANKRLILAGYPLSRIYPRLFENNVEAIAGGVPTAPSMWQEFKGSQAHRNHLLAEHEFYRLQDEIGVGFFYDEDSPHLEYWVVYLAHQMEPGPYKGEIAKSKD